MILQPSLFDYAKQFREAEEILIAHFWNYSILAALHAYLELVCTQGITFDSRRTDSTAPCVRRRNGPMSLSLADIFPGRTTDLAISILWQRYSGRFRK